MPTVEVLKKTISTPQTTSSDNNDEKPKDESGSFVAGNKITNSDSTNAVCSLR